MYLFIFEDGSKKLYESYSEDDASACDDGYIEIIDISVSNKPMQLFHGEWWPIEQGA